MNPIEAAKQFVKDEFESCHFVLVAGSVVRGEGTPTSDLDIVVIDRNLTKAYRKSVKKYGWPIEVFVHNEQTINEYFELDIKRRRPSLVKMVSEGIILKDIMNMGSKLKESAKQRLEKGPEPYSKEESEYERYFITDLLDDLIGSERFDEQVFIMNELTEKLCHFVLVNREEWVGRGKWIPRLLKKADEQLYQDIMKALEQFYTHRDKSLFIQIAERELEKYGGRLFDGHSS